MNVYDIMEEIEQVLSKGRLIPMMRDSVIINARELSELLEQLRGSLPVEITEANRVLGQRDGILSAANTQAGEIVRNAQETRRQLIANSEIVRAAESKARMVLSDANNKAESLRQASFEYVGKNLREAEEALAKSLQSLHATEQSLAQKRQK